MRYLILLPFLLFTLAATQANPTPSSGKSALDEKNGFRNFRLGAQLSEFPASSLKAIPPQSSDRKAFYALDKGGDIGAVKIRFIMLTFRKDILEEVVVATIGQANCQGLKAVLLSAFGPPTKDVGTVQIWNGDSTKLEFSISEASNRLSPAQEETAMAVYTNHEVTAKVDEMIRQKASEGAAEGARSL